MQINKVFQRDNVLSLPNHIAKSYIKILDAKVKCVVKFQVLKDMQYTLKTTYSYIETLHHCLTYHQPSNFSDRVQVAEERSPTK